MDSSVNQRSFKARVLMMILALLIFLFITIFAAFNISINSFIKTDAITQIDIFTKQYIQHNSEKGDAESSQLPDTNQQPKNRTGTKAEIFTINSDYQIIDFHVNEDGSNVTDSKNISFYLNKKGLNLSNINNYTLNSGGQEYYVTVIKDQKQSDAYAVIYVNISAIRRFVGAINLVLIIIMLVAAVLSFGIAAMIASSVNQPIKQLANFARQIGRGDFTRKEIPFADKEIKVLSDVMNQTAMQLDHYDNEQRIFYQNVSHEFRTPLMTIKCYAEGIQQSLMEPKKSSHIILGEIDYLSDMVEALLYLSRIDNLTIGIDKTTNDIRETFSACAENMKPIADRVKTQLVFNFDKAPVIFEYNEQYMYRALSNLITNALRYAKTQIVLTCKNDDKCIRLAVEDDGEGISADELPHIFKRFFKGKNGNHGIGLSIVKSVVELHGGRIIVNNNQGASFTILFDK